MADELKGVKVKTLSPRRSAVAKSLLRLLQVVDSLSSTDEYNNLPKEEDQYLHDLTVALCNLWDDLNMLGVPVSGK